MTKKCSKRYQKELWSIASQKNWSFAWKIENRHTYGDYDIFFPTPDFTKFLNPYENFSALFTRKAI